MSSQGIPWRGSAILLMVAAGCGRIGYDETATISGDEIATISGTVSGLVGTVVLQNSADALELSENGGFEFAMPVASGSPYDVTVSAQPRSPAQTCVVTGGSGTVTDANISVTVTCSTVSPQIGKST